MRFVMTWMFCLKEITMSLLEIEKDGKATLKLQLRWQITILTNYKTC